MEQVGAGIREVSTSEVEKNTAWDLGIMWVGFCVHNLPFHVIAFFLGHPWN